MTRSTKKPIDEMWWLEKLFVRLLAIPLWIGYHVLKFIFGTTELIKAANHDLRGHKAAALWTYGLCLSTIGLYKPWCVFRARTLMKTIGDFDFSDEFFRRHFSLPYPVRRITEKEDQLHDGRFHPVLRELRKIGPVRCSAF